MSESLHLARVNGYDNMLLGMITKLLLKASVPLIAVAGVMSYGVYMKGGDPLELWRHVGSGALGSAAGMLSSAKEDALNLAAKVPDLGDVGSGTSRKTRVFTWTDAQGVTHFGTSAPAQEKVSTLWVDPDVNIVRPVEAPVVVSPTDKQQEAETTNAQPDTRLPGIAGHLPAAKTDNSGGDTVDASELIKLLQSSRR